MSDNLPRKLRILRAERGLTMVQASERIGISRDTLHCLEHGQKKPHVLTLAKVARGYGVAVEELL